MKSMVTVPKGWASGSALMGLSGGIVRCVLTLFCWHGAQPCIYRVICQCMLGQKYRSLISDRVRKIPGCPYAGESW